MPKMIRFLIWEVFIKNRIALLAILFVVPVTWLLIQSYVMQTLGSYLPIENISLAIMLICVLFLYLSFSYVDSGSNDKHNQGFPSHLLRLPIPTWTLSVVPVLLATAVVTLFILFWANFVSETKLSGELQFTICTVAGVFISWSQAINWGLNTPLIQKVLLLLCIISGVLFSVLAIFDINEQSTLLDKTLGSLGLLFLLFGGYYLCFVTLAKSRRNESFQLHLKLPLLKSSKPLSSSAQLQQFSNGLSAQCWFEWKMLAFAIPLTISLIGIVELSALIMGAERKIISTGAIMMITVFLMSPYFIACNRLGSDKFDILQHNATRPLSNFDIAISKLHPLALAIFVSYLIFIFTQFLSLHIIELPDSRALAQGTTIMDKFDFNELISFVSLAFIISLATFWIISANICAILLRDSKLLFFICTVGFVGFGVGMLSLFVYFKNHTDSVDTVLTTSLLLQILANYPQMIPLIFTILILLLLAFLMRSFQQVASIRLLKKYFFICSLGLIISLGLLWNLNLPLRAYIFAGCSLLNLFLLCVTPFVIAPISVAFNRHR
jgi:hypothetical protein